MNDLPSNDALLGAVISLSSDDDDHTAALPLDDEELLGVLEYELRAEGELVEVELELECRWCRCFCLGGIGTEEDAMVKGPVRYGRVAVEAVRYLGLLGEERDCL